MKKLSTVCVFCGAQKAVSEEHLASARRFGKMLAEKNVCLVYGGGDSGMMGAVARSTLEHGGYVVGIFPDPVRKLEGELMGLSEIYHVDTMHERKKMMFYFSDAFIAFPGGFGTLDETFEIITWRQLRTHTKPVIIFNHQGYWDPLKALTDNILAEGFAPKETGGFFTYIDNIDDIIPTIEKKIQG
ncbi:MAG: TIGR00730 family Rossman fold protein [Alphaproteobacteria bacterium]|nr:TIGR00730 family Rossman fold protein [Alphaproteobacteria bacterium]